MEPGAEDFKAERPNWGWTSTPLIVDDKLIVNPGAKDTSLVAIVGLLDLVGIGKTVLAQPEFLGLQREVYVFISLLYWVLSYGMSYLSQRLEVSLGVGKR